MKLWLGKFPGCLRPPWLSSRSTTRQLRARFQRLPEAPKDFPKDSLQDPPGSSRILQDSPGSTRILQDQFFTRLFKYVVLWRPCMVRFVR